MTKASHLCTGLSAGFAGGVIFCLVFADRPEAEFPQQIEAKLYGDSGEAVYDLCRRIPEVRDARNMYLWSQRQILDWSGSAEILSVARLKQPQQLQKFVEHYRGILATNGEMITLRIEPCDLFRTPNPNP